MKNNLKKPQLIISSNKGVFSKLYQDIYFDKNNGIKESKHVYLDTNNLENKFKNTNDYIIAELGFGTGLNFLLTWNLWIKSKKKNSHLTYISFENSPLSILQLTKIHKMFRGLSKLSKLLLRTLPHVYQSNHKIYFKLGNISLILIYDDISSLKDFKFEADTWYLDGFSPSKNPLAWTNFIFQEIFKHTKYGASLSTYSVSGNVRRGLMEQGFNVSKVKGVGNKKEILYAHKNINNKIFTEVNTLKNNEIGPIAVIGAGISGASLIHALKKRNIDCFLVEASSAIASGASGNKVALQMPKLTLDDSPYGLLSLEAFSFSRKLAMELKAIPDTDGLIMLPNRDREISKFEQLLKNKWPLDLIKNKIENYKFLESVNFIHMKSSGIVDNQKFLKKMIKDVNIFFNFNVKNVETNNGLKEIFNNQGHKIIAKKVIWANGYQMLHLHDGMPIQPVSGQVTYLDETTESSKLNLNFSYGHFISQSFKGIHQVGASFNRNINKDYSQVDQIKNISSIPSYLHNIFNVNKINKLKYRVSIRGSTKDRMPFYGSLDKLTGKPFDNIYFLGGMGSWGFVYAPYYAELLVKEILNEPLIISEKIKKLLTIDRHL